MNPTEALRLAREALAALKLIRDQDQGCGGTVTEAEAWRSAQSIAYNAAASLQSAIDAALAQKDEQSEPVSIDTIIRYVEQREADEALMRQAHAGLMYARDAIESWGAYAGDYFRTKHDIDGDIERVEAAANALRERLEEKE